MKASQRIFLILSVCCVVFLATSIILSILFENVKAMFDTALINFILALLMLFEHKWAFIPLKTPGPRNTMKQVFYWFKNPKAYQKVCGVLFVVSFVLGVFFLIDGLLMIM